MEINGIASKNDRDGSGGTRIGPLRTLTGIE